VSNRSQAPWYLASRVAALLPLNEGFVSFYTPAFLPPCRWHFPSHSRVTAVAQPPYDARLARSGSGGPRHSRSCAANGWQRNLRPTVMTPLLPSARVAVFLLKQPQLCLICLEWLLACALERAGACVHLLLLPAVQVRFC